MSVCPSVCLSVHPSVCPSVSESFSLPAGSIFNQFSSNLLWELILRRSVLGLQMGKFWQISIELRPFIDVRNWYSFSLSLAFLYRFFFQTWYESQCCKGVFWDCRWVNFNKQVQSYSPWLTLEIFHSLSLAFFNDFLQTGYKSWYWKEVSWYCRRTNFDK